MARGLRPREALILRAVRLEAQLKKKAKRKAHKHRSWSMLRYKPFILHGAASAAILTTPPSLMNAEYLCHCMLKAALLKKRDLDLWRGYIDRVVALNGTFTAREMALIFYSIGKSLYPNPWILVKLSPQCAERIEEFNSLELTSVAWALCRQHVQQRQLLLRIVEEVVRRPEQIRPVDCVKIANCVAALGISGSPILSRLSKIVVEKCELLSAQNFRFAVSPVSLCTLHIARTQFYLLERLVKVRSIMRPEHWRAAYRSAIALRVTAPNVYERLPVTARTFLTRLSMKKLPWMARYPSKLHWDVSNHLAQIRIFHRNMFLWGCFWIDIGQLHDESHDAKCSNSCWMIDPPSSFYWQSTHYRAAVQLEHRVLWNLGWDIRRIPWFEWYPLKDSKSKREYLRKKATAAPDPEKLVNRSCISSYEVTQALQNMDLKFWGPVFSEASQKLPGKTG